MKLKMTMLLAVISIMQLVECKQNSHDNFIQLSQELERGFITPPDSIQTSVYWYWISDNISKEGAVRDLQAMKKQESTGPSLGTLGLMTFPTAR